MRQLATELNIVQVTTAWAVAVHIPFTARPGSQACQVSSTMSVVCSTLHWASLSFVSALFRWGRFW
jgi:hypothetical protein